MHTTLMGLETEYAFTPYDAGGQPLNRAHFSEKMVELAAERLPSMFGRDRHDLFLANGSRLYLDAAVNLLNLEYSTPETTNPAELVAHARAGDRILAGLARDLETAHAELHESFVSKTNFDYSGHTSGSHENYLHRSPQVILAPQLIPHLVSRIIYCGGGGFHADPNRIEFMLSPRVCFLDQTSAVGALNGRAIFSTRQESLSQSEYGRLHLMCGEGVRFELAEYLRFGTTALILRLIDSGLRPGSAVKLDPVPAINRVARDIRCRQKIGRIGGRPATAIDVQRHYLDQVQDEAGNPILPDWTDAVCERWRATLDALESDPLQLAGALDWPTKLGLYRTYVQRNGVDWRQISSDPDTVPHEFGARLFEFDVRFGDISGDGLDAALMEYSEPGARLVGDSQIDQARTAPPANSRARLRGAWIERLHSQREGKECNWHWIKDHHTNKSLRFDDPLSVSEVTWQDPGSRSHLERDNLQQLPAFLRD